MLFITREVLVEGIGRELDGLGDEARKGDAHGAHGLHVRLVDGLEAGDGGFTGPLVGCEEVVVEWAGGRGEGVGGCEVELFAVVDGAGGDFGGEAGVAEEGVGVLHFNFESSCGQYKKQHEIRQRRG